MKRLISFSLAAVMAAGLTAGAAGQTAQAAYYTWSVSRPGLSWQYRPSRPSGSLTGSSKPSTGGNSTGSSKPSTGGTSSDSNTTSQTAFAAEVVRLVNAERAKNGLSALQTDSRVTAAAQTRAGELKSSFSHSRPDGRSCFTALTEAGASYRGAGENIAYGQTTPQAVMNSWMNSSGHRANILSNKYTTIGVGYTVVNGTAYWTQLFTY